MFNHFTKLLQKQHIKIVVKMISLLLIKQITPIVPTALWSHDTNTQHMLQYIFRVFHLRISHTSMGSIWTSLPADVNSSLRGFKFGPLFSFPPQLTTIQRFIFNHSTH